MPRFYWLKQKHNTEDTEGTGTPVTSVPSVFPVLSFSYFPRRRTGRGTLHTSTCSAGTLYQSSLR